jgi:transcriptional regulator GlxA family with amidase domain
MLARITRFRRAAGLLAQGRVRSGADLAAAGGYVDQAHLIREFQEFAGTTPKLFRA